jgi:hypothetical protein
MCSYELHFSAHRAFYMEMPSSIQMACQKKTLKDVTEEEKTSLSVPHCLEGSRIIRQTDKQGSVHKAHNVLVLTPHGL